MNSNIGGSVDLDYRVAELEALLRAKSAEYEAVVSQQAALVEVLEVINASPGEFRTSLDAIVEKAFRLCDATGGGLWLVDGNTARAAGGSHLPDAFWEFTSRTPARLIDLLGRNPGAQTFFQVEDLKATKPYKDQVSFIVASAEIGGIRTYLGVPLREDGAVVGVLTMIRDHVRPFTSKQIALVQAFAAQALVALKNARLFNETKEALERQTATAEILRVIASSPSNTQPVFEAIARSAKRLLAGHSCTVARYVDGAFHLAAFTPVNPEADAAAMAMYPLRRSADLSEELAGQDFWQV